MACLVEKKNSCKKICSFLMKLLQKNQLPTNCRHLLEQRFLRVLLPFGEPWLPAPHWILSWLYDSYLFILSSQSRKISYLLVSLCSPFTLPISSFHIQWQLLRLTSCHKGRNMNIITFDFLFKPQSSSTTPAKDISESPCNKVTWHEFPGPNEKIDVITGGGVLP